MKLVLVGRFAFLVLLFALWWYGQLWNAALFAIGAYFLLLALQRLSPHLGFTLLSRYYDQLLSNMEINVISPLRKEYCVLARGKTLDAGSGTGNNINFFPNGVEVVMLDPSSAMLQCAKQKAANRSIHCEFVQGVVERLPFEDASFDTGEAHMLAQRSTAHVTTLVVTRQLLQSTRFALFKTSSEESLSLHVC
jgi:SAM-dependent methyltransferase